MEHDQLQILVVGGGVAALEAALALRDVGGDRVAIRLLAPEREFVYRPERVREPFAFAAARRYPLERIASDLEAELIGARFKWLDPDAKVVHTDSGEELSYQALLLAPGAKRYRRYPQALTIDDANLDEQLHGLIQDIEGGYVHSLAFVLPTGPTWPLPAYELALLSAARADDVSADVKITIATPEDAPLAIFGPDASDGVRRVLEEAGITIIASAHSEVPEPGHVTITPGARHVKADRVITLPELHGPSLPGVPTAHRGFIPVDPYGNVRGLQAVWAAGDATDFAVKHGGLAAQAADTAAQAIAAAAGLALAPVPFHPTIHATLLTGGKPVQLSAHITGGHGQSSYITAAPTVDPSSKITASHLSPYLHGLDQETVSTHDRRAV
ncbi:MAG: FAD-dependent oxidoreductase [Actinomycetota bacterium]|nr:FAD-dependent oxidoreductase [Actinomycetota bacterium]